MLSIAGLGLLLWAIIEAPTHGWSSGPVIGVGFVSLAALGGFIAWEIHSRHPMLKLRFFRDRRFSIAALGESLGIFGLLGGLFIATQFLQFDLGYSPLQAGLRILPTAAVLVAGAALSPIVVRFIGTKFTLAAGLTAIAGGLWQISAASALAATYGDVVPGLLLVGLGAGLLLPAATNSIVSSVSQGDAGVGSATNSVAVQVGGALGVAVIGSEMSTRYRDHMSAALAGRHVPIAATHTILGSLGGALGVAKDVGGVTGSSLARAARSAFMSGANVSLLVGAFVALAGVFVVLAFLRSRTSPDLSVPKTHPSRPGDHSVLVDESAEALGRRRRTQSDPPLSAREFRYSASRSPS
jgi:hypothetical protein